MLNLRSSSYNIRNGGEGQYEFFADISTRSLLTVRVGEGAGKISTGVGNAFVGFEAGKENNEGSYGVFVGFQAGSLNHYANYCTYVGAYAGRENRRGDNNTFVGYRAGEFNKDGSECVAVGAYAMRENYSGNRSVAIGYRAAERNLDADFNTIIGAEAGQDNRSGNYNTMAGYRVGRALFRGNQNTYFGAFAGYSNSFGDGNCLIGFRAGYEVTGNNNVLVGVNVASNLSGNENVIMGANTLTKYQTNGTVVVGYQIGSTFERGNCNVFIGYEVDTHDPTTSFGIAIGTKKLKTYHYAVTIGNDIENSGLSSVGIGHSIITDSENSVTIGNNIDVSSVYLLSDRLDYRFPVNLAKTYTLFNVQESYCNTIFDGINSNTSAIFSKNTCNVYDSGTHRSQRNYGTVYDYTKGFYYNILFQGRVIRIIDQTDQIETKNTITDSSYVRTQNISASEQLTTDPAVFNNYHSTHSNDITVTFSSNLYNNVNSSSYPYGIMGINIVKLDSNVSFTYKSYFPKNYSIYNLVEYTYRSNLFIEDIFDNIRYNCNIIAWPPTPLSNQELWSNEPPFEYISNFDSTINIYSDPDRYTDTCNIIIRQPKYGSIQTNLFPNNFIYNIYPESLFSSNDSFLTKTGRSFNGIYSISSTPVEFQIYTSNTEYFNSNEIVLHPVRPYYISRAHILRKPLYDDSTTVTANLGTNITFVKDTISLTSTNNPINMTYFDISVGSNYFIPTNNAISINDQAQFTINVTPPVYYPLRIRYDAGSNFIINKDNYTIWPFPSTGLTSNSSNELVHIQNIHSNILRGSVWQNLDRNPTSSTRTFLYIVKQPQYGYLYSSNLARNLNNNVVSRISYENFKSHSIHYIPYTPLNLSNDSYQFYLGSNGYVSDVYTMTLKNYWSQFSPIIVDYQRTINSNYYVNPTTLPRSSGLIQDNKVWSFNNSRLSILNYTNVPYTTETILFSERPYFKQTNISTTINKSTFSYLSNLLDPDVIVSSNSRDLHFFVESQPKYGAIYKSNVSGYYADPYFTYNDIVSKKVFYHHYGENTNTDQFNIYVGSLQGQSNVDNSVFDVSYQPLTYTINFINVSSTLEDQYIYKSNVNEILNNYYPLPKSSLDFSYGYVHIQTSNNLDIYNKVDPNTYSLTNVLSVDDFDTGKIYYKINSNIYLNNSNQNVPLEFTFYLTNSNVYSSNAINSDTDPLYSLPYYKTLKPPGISDELQVWRTYLNTYASSNFIKKELDNTQTVQYKKRSFTDEYVSFDNRRLQIEFILYPEQQVLYTDNTFPHANYLEFLNSFAFDFKILNSNQQDLLVAKFKQNQVTIYDSNINNSITIPINITLNEANTISFILNDDRNNENLSMYINNNNYLGSIAYKPYIPSQSNIGTLLLTANINDSNNYYNAVITSNINDNVYLYYNLDHYTNRLKFNDFNIFVDYYDKNYRETLSTEQYVFDSNIHNIAIGKILDIKGLNNICIGTNFKTIGSDSIIIGNSIGTQVSENIEGNTLNEIFTSIVIANNSFGNSKVRDVIAIGNNILGDVPIDITEFLLKKPIIIGNDISTDTIDFHINVQNTFLKTTEAPNPGIYLGLNSEIVAIGYTSNVSFNNDSQLYVNGNIKANDLDVDNLTVNGVSYAYVPRGAILMWSGATTNIPTGWLICDGNNGTPDLRDRFIIGAGRTYPVDKKSNLSTSNVTLKVANLPTHTHTGTTNVRGGHDHGETQTDPGGWGRDSETVRQVPNSGIFDNISVARDTGNHYHRIDNDGAHDHNVTTNTTSGANADSFSILPPYYALAYIMKT